MREIKFRFWSKVLGGFVNPDNNILAGTFKDPNMVVMQYTGLKDKNGKEIYESDIVKCQFAFEDDICEVVEDKGCFWVSQKNKATKDIAHDNLYWHNDGCEIIGNIYSNPELIK